MSTLAEVRLWGSTIGAVSLAEDRDWATFQYDPEFTASGIELSPIIMPLSSEVYGFSALPRRTFYGLPGLLADSLPDKFGHALIDAWLATQGRTPAEFNPVERLCYVGERGMGALEFVPAIGPRFDRSTKVRVDALVDLASHVLRQRGRFAATIASGHETDALRDLLRVGTSAGGARAKAVIAWNRSTDEIRSGQTDAGPGFEYWLLKFDGVEGNSDRELDDPKGYCAVEYAYALMAKAAGIVMTECRLLAENGRRHFMTKRFDRLDGGGKLHMQSLGAIAHLDYDAAGAHSYEQALLTARQIGLSMTDIEMLFRRMVFNVVARNQDDHVKNIAFLMNRSGEWSLAPAFDLTWSYNPEGLWTARHQMTVNGKRDDFTMDDFRRCAATASIKRTRVKVIVDDVMAAVSAWSGFANEAGVSPAWRQQIDRTLRLVMPEK